MKTLALLVFCVLCTVTQVAYANGSVHHNNTTVNNATGGDAVAVGHGGSARSNSDANARSSSDADARSNSSVSLKEGDYEVTASSASVYLSGCQQGVGAQAVGLGASTGGESRVCQLLRLAAAHQALGQPYEAMRLVRQATEEMNGGGYTPAEAPPLARASRWFRRNLVAPLFSWLPFVGHSV